MITTARIGKGLKDLKDVYYINFGKIIFLIVGPTSLNFKQKFNLIYCKKNI
jgi:hypothetical protein